MPSKALFLDRDGVINKDLGHVHKKEDFVFLNDIFELASCAKKYGYLLIVITNQAGIGKGLYTENDFKILNKWMIEQFELRDIEISKVYFSPYHPKGVITKYKKNHFSRKPQPGMIYDAKKEFNINLNDSILIGDKESDIEAGISASVGTNIFLINKNYDLPKLKPNRYYSVKKLIDAKKFLKDKTS